MSSLFWKQLSTDSKKKLKLVETQVFSKYGITGKKPFATGGFAFVYLQNNRIIRLAYRENMQKCKHTNVLNQIRQVHKMGEELLPKLYESELYSTSHALPACILVTVMEKLDIIDWEKWPSYFKDEVELTDSIFESIFALLSKRIVHKDISQGNVVLTKSGIKFIDFDEVCLPILNINANSCLTAVLETPGYSAPEAFLNELNPKYSAAHVKLFKREYNIDLNEHTPTKYIGNANTIYQNVIYGAGALVYSIVTQSDPSNFKLSKLPTSIRSTVSKALHPLPHQRKLGMYPKLNFLPYGSSPQIKTDTACKIRTTPKPKRKSSIKKPVTPPKPTSNKKYLKGPRGGCYTMANGKKKYVNKSLCD